LYYHGPTGHAGGVSLVCYNEEAKALITSGKDGIVRMWNPNCGVNLENLKEKNGGLDNREDIGSVNLGKILQHGAAARSIDWPVSKKGEPPPTNILLGTSTNSIIQLEFNPRENAFGRVKEIVR